MSERRYSQGHIRLSEHMLDVSILEAGAFEDLARGLTTQAQHATDRFHAQEVGFSCCYYLFVAPKKKLPSSVRS